ncbi:MAG: sigma-70 family RNA polymerase sigma factor [Isosphaeraceae bacterium]|nr:sigma-70 family RNA polymerase sigma factor [Isosphaeraceae bacterium]
MPDAACDLETDDVLVAKGRAGDRAALEELFRRHHGVAHRVAYRLLGHEEDAKDAVQNGFIKALRHLGDFDGRSGFRTWLLKIVTNAALDLGRSRRRRSMLTLVDPDLDDASGPAEPAVDDDPSTSLRRQDLARLLNGALDRLGGDKRAAFVLFVEGGLSYEEIAEAQGTPIGTVMSRIYYARQKLQSYLQGVEGL